MKVVEQSVDDLVASLNLLGDVVDEVGPPGAEPPGPFALAAGARFPSGLRLPHSYDRCRHDHGPKPGWASAETLERERQTR